MEPRFAPGQTLHWWHNGHTNAELTPSYFQLSDKYGLTNVVARKRAGLSPLR